MFHMVKLSELLGKKSTLLLLEYFTANPTKKSYLAKLAKEIKLSKVSIINALRSLKNSKFLLEERVGRTTLYSLNNGNPVARSLKILFTVSRILEYFKSFEGFGGEIYLYGSAARGENDEKSDIDILAIADKKGEIKPLIRKIEDEGINILFLTQFEYSELYRKDRALYERMEKDKIRLV